MFVLYGSLRNQFFKESSVCRVVTQFFRMPLDGQQEAFVRGFKGFDDMILCGVGRYFEPLSQLIDRLMMEGVDASFFLQDSA